MRASRPMVLVAAVVVTTVLWAAPGPATAASGRYAPHIDPSDFSTTVDNPWFPLPPGSVHTFHGMEDGKPTVDVVTVTPRTLRIEGVDTVVVRDDVSKAGKLAESTFDYYAQDDQGTVWYFGEDTHTVDTQGRVKSTEGTWRAGRRGAQPGVVMQAHPVVGHRLRQEYLKGHAEDWYRVTDLARPVAVPAGSFTNALVTAEWSPLEPGVLDSKYYVPGIGAVAEATLKGPAETLQLTSVQ